MKQKHTILLGLATLLFSQMQALEYEVPYENEYVSVEKYTISPHETTELHRDVYPHLVLGIKGGTVERLEADGRTQEVVFPTGAFVMRGVDPEGELHRTVSKSDEPIELLVVQLKQTTSSSQKITDAASAYVNFINRLAKGEDFDQFAAAKSILSPDCKKIFNGALITSSCDQFVQDLLQVYQTYGSWTIQPVDTIISQESNTAVLRLVVDIDALGKFTEILILRFNQQQLITELNIVFSKVQDGYNFEQKADD